MFCVGIAGNIGSGKSKACEHFKQLGIGVISADAISRELTAINTPALKEIIDYFGQSIIDQHGELNRKALRDRVFSNHTMRAWLENLLHPLIRTTIQQRIHHSTSPYCVIEIPLLKNKQHYPYLNRILVITANQDSRIKRVMQRDNCDWHAAMAIIGTQPFEEAILPLADDIIINNGSIDDLNQSINQLHADYLFFAEKVFESSSLNKSTNRKL